MELTTKQILYNKFIVSPEWEAIKDNLFTLRGKKCEVCGSIKNIEVHHLTYKRFGGNEKSEDLKILCRKHHEQVHNIKVKKVRKNLPYYRKIAIDKFGLPKKGNRGWIGLAKSISTAKGFNKFKFNKKSAKRYVINNLL